MTDILSRLSAFTGFPEGTTPRPWKVGAQNPMTGEINVHRQYRDPSFTSTGGIGIRVVATLGNRHRRELDEEARANAELIVEAINREAALVALVQEVAREIERLRDALRISQDTLEHVRPLVQKAGVPPLSRKIGILSGIGTSGAHKITFALKQMEKALNSREIKP